MTAVVPIRIDDINAVDATRPANQG